MIAAARAAAYEVLRAVGAGSANLPNALARVRTRLADERDRALAGEIAAGTLRWRGSIDHVIATFTGKPVTRLDPEVLDILRITLFQLLHLTRVPASAAVNDAVSLSRRVGKTSAAPLVNAVSRRVSRERDHLPLPERPPTPADRERALDYLSITLSHPRWLVARWLDRCGFEATEAWARFNNAAPLLTLRANRLRTTRAALADRLAALGVQTTAGILAPDALICTEGNPLQTKTADEGLFVVQEEASQLVTLMAAARRGERILDACASPGGKTTAMAADMDNTGLIVATDVRGKRVDLLARTVERAGATCARVVQADASRPLPFSTEFDCVLLDAPCSGLGTIRRDPDIRWSRTEGELAALAAAQLRMLKETSQVVKAGGRLIYSTCSSEPEENEHVVDAFLAADLRFTLTQPTNPGDELRRLLDNVGRFRTLPFRDTVEAFFAAILVKSGV